MLPARWSIACCSGRMFNSGAKGTVIGRHTLSSQRATCRETLPLPLLVHLQIGGPRFEQVKQQILLFQRGQRQRLQILQIE